MKASCGAHESAGNIVMVIVIEVLVVFASVAIFVVLVGLISCCYMKVRQVRDRRRAGAHTRRKQVRAANRGSVVLQFNTAAETELRKWNT